MKTQHNGRNSVFLTLMTATVLGGVALSTARAADDSKKEALAWIDSYRKVQVMFHDKDIERVRKKLEESTPEKAAEWLKDTKEMRKALDSPEWKETRVWFKEFLKVQAIYTDEQIEEFRKKVAETAKKSPKKIKVLLSEIEARRKATIGGASTSAALRKQQVTINDAYRQQQVAQRDKIRKEKAEAMADADPGPGPQVKGRDYRRPPSLIDSMDVARWSVMREFLPRW